MDDKQDASEPDVSQTYVADDYRGQLQSRYGSEMPPILVETALLIKPKLISHAKSFLSDWSSGKLSDQIDNVLSNTKLNTSLDEPLGHKIIQALREQIEAAATGLNLPLHGGVSAGVLHAGKTEAMQQPVMMTNTSVIQITANLLMLCNRLAKLLARTVVVERDQSGVRVTHDIGAMKQRVDIDMELREDWLRLFIDCAYDPNSPLLGKVYGLTGDRQIVWLDMLQALELFVVGHEYGHHIAKHSLEGEVTVNGEDRDVQHEKELEADGLGTLLSQHAGISRTRPNIYSTFGIGATCVLTILEFVHRSRHIVLHGMDPSVTRTSHPDLHTRIRIVRTTVASSLQEDHVQGAMLMQSSFIEILDYIWGFSRAALVMMHSIGAKPAEQSTQWLPK